MNDLKDKGLTPNDERIKHYELYSKGDCWTPARFYAYALVDKRKPYDITRLTKSGFIRVDINNIINRFDGISFEFLVN